MRISLLALTFIAYHPLGGFPSEAPTDMRRFWERYPYLMEMSPGTPQPVPEGWESEAASIRKSAEPNLKGNREKAAQSVRDLLRQARSGKTSAERYAAYEVAARAAGNAILVNLAVQALHEQSRFFAVKSLGSLIRDRLDEMARVSKVPETLIAIADEYVELGQELAAVNDFSGAESALRQAEALAQKTNAGLIVSRSKEGQVKLESVRGEYDKRKIADRLGAIQAGSASMVDELMAGLFLCLIKEDWETGLPILQKHRKVPEIFQKARTGSDPLSLDQLVERAEEWRALAKKEEAPFQPAMERQAAIYLCNALPRLAKSTLAAKKQIEARKVLKECMSSLVKSQKKSEDLVLLDVLLQNAVLALHFEPSTLWEDGGNLYVRDLSGMNNHGRVNGCTFTPGRFGTALRLNGKSDFVESSRPTNGFPKDKAARTISMWLKYDRAQEGDAHLFCHGHQGGGEHVSYLRLNGRQQPQYTIESYQGPILKQRIAKDKWTHLAVTYEGVEGQTCRVFIDGKQEGSETIKGPGKTENAYWVIGRHVSGRGEYFRGDIDEILVFDRELTEGEIHLLYKLGSSGVTARRFTP